MSDPKTVENVVIIGTGSYLPERVLTNTDLEKMVDTTDEWIVSRTGMRERRIAADDQATSDMGAIAAQRAIDDAGITAEDIDLIIVATATPDMAFPNTACFVQNLVGAKNATCMDVEAACSGFLYAMDVAKQFIAAGSVRTALVIGAEKLSSIIDWEDRATCVLFGDGAGAAILQADGAQKGLMNAVMGSDGSLTDLLMVPGGGSRHPASPETISAKLHFLKMNGREVFKHAVTNMTSAAREAVERADLTMKDIDWVIPHQANARILSAIAQRLELPGEKMITNVEKTGNTSAASVGIALDEAVKDGRIKKGDMILCVVFGGGFTWGATVIEWTKE